MKSGTGVNTTSEKTRMMMFINTDNITDVTQEGIVTEALIRVQGSVSTGCLLHSHASGCDFLKGILDSLILFFSSWQRASDFPTVRKRCFGPSSPGPDYLFPAA